MRFAVIVADRGHPPSTARDEQAKWLGSALAALDFNVITLDVSRDVKVDLGRALAGTTAEDTVLVHLSGRLAPGPSLLCGEKRSLALAAVKTALPARKLASAVVIAEVICDDSADDALLAVEHVEQMRGALDPRATGHGALLAVRARSLAGDALPFSRLLLRVADAVSAEARDERGAPLSEVVERMHGLPEIYATAQSHAFVPGTVDLEIAPASDAPAFEPLLALADTARERQAWDQALAGYRAALRVAPPSAEARSSVFARIGAVKIAIATDAGDWARVVELSRERVERLDAATEKADELFAIARTLLEEMRDLPGAVAELEKARAIDPAREDVLEALRRSYRVLTRWPELFDVTGALADQAPSATERAARRLAQAKIALEHMDDAPRALPLLEAALVDDPTHDEALDVLVELRTSRGERSELARALGPLVARLEQLGEDERARDASRRLVTLQVDARDDESIAVEMTGNFPRVDAERIVALEALADGFLSRGLVCDLEHEHAEHVDGDETAELERLEAAAVASPLDVPTHAALFELHLRAERIDRAYLSALALEELGAIGAEHRALLDQHRPEGLVPRRPLDEAAWQRMRPVGADDVVESLFRAIARAAIASRVEQRRTRRKLPRLDPSRLQSATSTASVVRSFHWAARSLGVPCPSLYVMDEVPGEIAAVPAAEPATAIGPGVVRGLSIKDLAFLAGRHLTYYRPEHALLVHFPTREGLTALVLAAVQLVLPAMTVPLSIAPAVAELRQLLARHLKPDERAAMTTAVRLLDARGGRLDLPAWTRSIELLGSRAGLLLCGDLRTAMALIRDESRGVAGVTVEQKRADLLAFCASRALADLRADFAAASSTSVPPPRSSGVMSREETSQVDWKNARGSVPPSGAAAS